MNIDWPKDKSVLSLEKDKFQNCWVFTIRDNTSGGLEYQQVSDDLLQQAIKRASGSWPDILQVHPSRAGGLIHLYLQEAKCKP